MREDQYAVLRWLATDDLAMLAGYFQSVADCERLGWTRGPHGDRRLTVAGRAAYEQELQRRQLAGLAPDIDPLNLAA